MHTATLWLTDTWHKLSAVLAFCGNFMNKNASFEMTGAFGKQREENQGSEWVVSDFSLCM